MINISNIIIQNTPPKDTTVGWAKPSDNNRFDLFFFIDGNWVSEGEASLELEDLYKRIAKLEKDKQDKLIINVTDSEILPNVYNKITPDQDLILFLKDSTDVLPEYTGEIVFNDEVFTIIWGDNIIWDDEPVYQPNCTYVFSILNGYGVMREFIRP